MVIMVMIMIMMISVMIDDDYNDFNDDGFRLHFPVYVSYCAAQPAMDRRLKQLRY